MDIQVREVGFMRLYEDAKIPTFGNDDPTNAGMDFYAVADSIIPAYSSLQVGTGVAWTGMGLMTTYWKPVLIIQSRSGMSFKVGVEAGNAGIIDCGYTGEIRVKLHNEFAEPFHIRAGDRIAQGVVYMVPHVQPVEVTEIQGTTRGDTGFGASGK